tara:strand:- start:205 stop:456 length:252 start_codon:yes stop_codon:yes gene_type:complete
MNPLQFIPIDSVVYGIHDMTNVKKSSLIDMIMVQVISITLGAFLMIAFNANDMRQTELTYSMAILFTSLLLTGAVYRRLSDRG